MTEKLQETVTLVLGLVSETVAIASIIVVAAYTLITKAFAHRDKRIDAIQAKVDKMQSNEISYIKDIAVIKTSIDFIGQQICNGSWKNRNRGKRK